MAGRISPDYSPMPQLQPAQTAVDSYVYPGRTAPDDTLGALAASLQGLEPTLGAYVQEKQKQQTAEDLAAGEQKYLETKTKLKDAVDKGLIPAGASPAFQRGYQQSELRVLGLTYDQQLRDAYQKAGLGNSTDTSAITGFTTDFTAQFLKDNAAGYDPVDVAHVLLPTLEGSQANLSAYHASQVAQNIEQGNLDNAEVEVSTALDNALAQNKDVNHAQLGSVLSATVNRALSNGGNAKAYNQMVVDQVIAKAQETGDVSFLNVLDSIKTGPGGNLGKTTYAKEHRIAAEENITSHQMQVEAFNERQADKAKADQADAVLGQAINAITANPSADMRPYMNVLSKLDPSKAAGALSLQQAMLSASTRVVENPAVKATIYADIDAAGSKEEQNAIIVHAAQARMINADTVGELHRYGDDQLKLKPTVEQPWYKAIETGVNKQLSMKDQYGTELPNVPIYQEAARRRLKLLAKSWISKNSDAGGKFSSDDLELYLEDQSDAVVKAYRQRMGNDADSGNDSPNTSLPAAANPFDATQQQN